MFQLTFEPKDKAPLELAELPSQGTSELSITGQSFPMWEEHCVECAPPDCYTSCKLFVSRSDSRCARFVYGILRNKQVKGAYDYGAQIRFRRWAKLESHWPKSPKQYSRKSAKYISSLLNSIEFTAARVTKVLGRLDRKKRITTVCTRLLNIIYPRVASTQIKKNEFDGFLSVIYSDESLPSEFTFEIMDGQSVVFRHEFLLNSGWNYFFIDKESLPVLTTDMGIARLSNNTARDITIIISWMHWVKFASRRHAYDLFSSLTLRAPESQNTPNNHVKCCVFDLDNTLWTGVIGDDGIEGVSVRQEVVQLIHELDKRGIICAVSSKNEFELAWTKIEQLGLSEFLLFPRINWNPKSANIRSIAKDMNVSLDTFAFIDDNPFERAEVHSQLPQVRLFSEKNVLELLNLPDFCPPVTEASLNRRLSYLAESKRKQVKENSCSDADSFLTSCEMKLTLHDAMRHFNRCHELLERTNQFNLSGRRRTEKDFLEELKQDLNLSWSIKDKFGDYGIVGFLRIIVKEDRWIMTDFVMSCRVAEKRVEECLFQYILEKAQKHDVPIELTVNHTERNVPLRKKFTSLGLIVLNESEDRTELQFPKSFSNYSIVQLENDWHFS